MAASVAKETVDELVHTSCSKLCGCNATLYATEMEVIVKLCDDGG